MNVSNQALVSREQAQPGRAERATEQAAALHYIKNKQKRNRNTHKRTKKLKTKHLKATIWKKYASGEWGLASDELFLSRYHFLCDVLKVISEW